jgi:hypothetical protein
MATLEAISSNVMGRFREIKARARRDVHREMSVPALYFAVAGADPIECTVRTWLMSDMLTFQDLGPLGQVGAELTNPEDRIRFDLSQVPVLRRGAVIAILPGIGVMPNEAYRIDHLYPVDLGWQTARVLRVSDFVMPSPGGSISTEGGFTLLTEDDGRVLLEAA